MIEIRKAKEEDVSYLRQFFNAYGFDYFHELITYVVDENKKIVGASQLKIENSCGEIVSLVIDENVRGNGFGDGLLKMLINHCYIQNIQFIKVKRNKAEGFFKKAGFIEKDDYLVLNVQAFYFNLRCRK